MIRRYVQRDCGVRTEFNPKTNEIDVVVRIPEPPPLVGLLIGDCVHNLRAALDHIVYALIKTNPARPPNTPNRSTMFPIRDTREGYESQVNKLQRLAGLPDNAAAVVRALQPYNTREKGLNHKAHPLFVLDALENIDKHRRLTVAAGISNLVHVKMRDSSGGDADLVFTSHMLHDGAVLTSFPGAQRDEVQVQAYLAVYVALKEARELRSMLNQDVLAVLTELVAYIGNDVLMRFGRVAIGRKLPRPRRRRQDLRLRTNGRPGSPS